MEADSIAYALEASGLCEELHIRETSSMINSGLLKMVFKDKEILEKQLEKAKEALREIKDKAYAMLDQASCTEDCHSTEETKKDMRVEIAYFCGITDSVLKELEEER